MFSTAHAWKLAVVLTASRGQPTVKARDQPDRGGAVADVMKICANCGNPQATGDFCDNCGTRLPAGGPASPAAGAGATTYAAPRQSAPAPASRSPYGAESGYGDPPQQYNRTSRRGAPRRGFFARLFDFSFEEFITPSIIKVLFIIAMVIIGLSVLGGIIVGFMSSAGLGVGALIGGLIFGFFALLYARVILEVFIVFFRIRDDTEEIANSKR